MPGSWPEPFGLVLIESLACGTPVIARRIGALPEILRDGVDGFFGDDVKGMAFKVDRVADLDRRAIRESVLDRFSVERMTDRYEAVYAARLDAAGSRSPSDRAAQRGDEDSEEPEQLAAHRMGTARAALTDRRSPAVTAREPGAARCRGTATRLRHPDRSSAAASLTCAVPRCRPAEDGSPQEVSTCRRKPGRDKRERQYEHIKDSYRSVASARTRPRSVAARTVNKERTEAGETKAQRKGRSE